MAKGTILLICVFGLFDCLGNAGGSICVNNNCTPDSSVVLTTEPGNLPIIDSLLPGKDSIADFPVETQRDTTLRIRLIETFRTQVGVRQSGNNTGEEVDRYLSAVGLDPGHPWCGAFIGWGYLEHNLTIPTAAAWSPAWFPRARIIPNEKARVGDVGGIYFQSLGRIAHVFVYDQNPSRNSNFAITIEGNTNDDGGRMGHSVMRKKRSLNKIRSSANWIDSDKPP